MRKPNSMMVDSSKDLSKLQDNEVALTVTSTIS